MPPDAAIHDTTLVDQAIGLRARTAEATLERLRAADRRLDAAQAADIRRSTSSANTAALIAEGWRAMMVAAGVSLVILSLGVAAWLNAPADAPAPAAERRAVTERPEVTAPSGRDDIIVSDYVIFTKSSRTIGGRDFVIQAGHRYLDERAGTFTSAWCYTLGQVGGVSYWLDLGTLESGEAPVPETDPQDETRAALGLDAGEAEAMFAACPWLASGPAPQASAATHASSETSRSGARRI